MKKLEMLQILSEKVSKCTKCVELVENRTQTVMSSGNPNAKILCISEAPGYSEDQKGEVLIGPAGQLFSNITAACGLDRINDLYLCNIIKCRPPNNRKPTQQEANNCEGFLKLQIKIINPKIILCLGNVAAQNLLKVYDPISSLRKQWFKYNDSFVNADVLCTYHPSHALRQGKEIKKEIWEDMQILIEKIKLLDHVS